MRAFFACLPWLTACSLLDPTVGPPVDTDACTLGSSGYGSMGYASPPSGSTAIADFCTVDGGTIQSTCDMCEATSCCMQRADCYLDQTCACADMTLDTCLGATDGGVAPVCWTTFASTGPIGTSRYQCLQTSCSSPCQIAN